MLTNRIISILTFLFTSFFQINAQSIISENNTGVKVDIRAILRLITKYFKKNTKGT